MSWTVFSLFLILRSNLSVALKFGRAHPYTTWVWVWGAVLAFCFFCLFYLWILLLRSSDYYFNILYRLLVNLIFNFLPVKLYLLCLSLGFTELSIFCNVSYHNFPFFNTYAFLLFSICVILYSTEFCSYFYFLTFFFVLTWLLFF